MTALTALIELHAVDIDTAAREPACQINRVGGDLAFERRACTPLAETRGGVGIFMLEESEPVSHTPSFSERDDLCTSP